MLLPLSMTSHASGNVTTCSHRDADVSPNTCSWVRRHRLHMQNALAGGDGTGYIGSARCPLLNSSLLLPHALPSYTLSPNKTAFRVFCSSKKKNKSSQNKMASEDFQCDIKAVLERAGPVLACNKELLNVMRQIISCRQIGKQTFLEDV